MTTQALTPYQEQTHELTLPDGTYLRHEMEAVRDFQHLVHELMIKDSDYGRIPGTQKDTLLKPGAEKIIKLLGLAEHYIVQDKIEDWDRPLFRYVILCQLVSIRTGTVVAEGIGECNSYETKYRYRWLTTFQLPAGTDTAGLVRQERKSKNGSKFFVYRFDNDEIFGQINTLMKMACKRALVMAALSVGRLSEVFTQDLEDMPRSAVNAGGDDFDDEAYSAAQQPARNASAPRQQPPAAGRVVEGTATPYERAVSRYGPTTAEFATIRGLAAQLEWQDGDIGREMDRLYQAKAKELTEEQIAAFIAHLEAEVARQNTPPTA